MSLYRNNINIIFKCSLLFQIILIFFSIKGTICDAILVDPVSGIDNSDCYLEIHPCLTLNYALLGITSVNYTVKVNVTEIYQLPISPITITTNFTLHAIGNPQPGQIEPFLYFLPQSNSIPTFTFTPVDPVNTVVDFVNVGLESFEYLISGGFISAQNISFKMENLVIFNVSIVGSGFVYPISGIVNPPIPWSLIVLENSQIFLDSFTVYELYSDSSYAGLIYSRYYFDANQAHIANISLHRGYFRYTNSTPIVVDILQEPKLPTVPDRDLLSIDVYSMLIQDCTGYSSNFLVVHTDSTTPGVTTVDLDTRVAADKPHLSSSSVFGRETITNIGDSSIFVFGNLFLFNYRDTCRNSTTTITIINTIISESDISSNQIYSDHAAGILLFISNGTVFNLNVILDQILVQHNLLQFQIIPIHLLASISNVGHTMRNSSLSITNLDAVSNSPNSGFAEFISSFAGSFNTIFFDSLSIYKSHLYSGSYFTIIAGPTYTSTLYQQCALIPNWPHDISCHVHNWNVTVTNCKVFDGSGSSEFLYLYFSPSAGGFAVDNVFYLSNLEFSNLTNTFLPAAYQGTGTQLHALISLTLSESWFNSFAASFLKVTDVDFGSMSQVGLLAITSGIAVASTNSHSEQYSITDSSWVSTSSFSAGAISFHMISDQFSNEFNFDRNNFTNCVGIDLAGAISFYSIGNAVGDGTVLRFAHSQYTSNVCESDGGAISLRYGSGIDKLTFYFSSFTNNSVSSGSGGAVAIFGFESFDPSSNQIVYPTGNLISISRISFDENYANISNGGAISLVYPSMDIISLQNNISAPNIFAVSDCTFDLNVASVGAVLYGAGAIQIEFSHTTNDSVKVQDNIAQLAEIYVDLQYPVNLTGLEWRNTAPRFLPITETVGQSFSSNSNSNSQHQSIFDKSSNTQQNLQLEVVPVFRSLSQPKDNYLDVSVDCPAGYVYSQVCHGTVGLFCTPCPITTYSLTSGSNRGVSQNLNFTDIATNYNFHQTQNQHSNAYTNVLNGAILLNSCPSLVPQHVELGKSNICYTCPPGGTCLGGFEVFALPNYWGMQSRYCPRPVYNPPENYSQELEKLLFGDPSICFLSCPTDYCCQSDSCPYDYCYQNRGGVLCGSCISGYSLSFGVTKCVPSSYCESFWPKFLLFVMMPLLTFLYMVILVLNPIGKNPLFKSLSYVFQILPIVAPLWQRNVASAFEFLSWTSRLKGVSQASSLDFSLSSVFENGICTQSDIQGTTWLLFPIIGPILSFGILFLMYIFHRLWCNSVKFRFFAERAFFLFMTPGFFCANYFIWRFYLLYSWLFGLSPLPSEVPFPESELGRFDSLRAYGDSGTSLGNGDEAWIGPIGSRPLNDPDPDSVSELHRAPDRTNVKPKWFNSKIGNFVKKRRQPKEDAVISLIDNNTSSLDLFESESGQGQGHQGSDNHHGYRSSPGGTLSYRKTAKGVNAKDISPNSQIPKPIEEKRFLKAYRNIIVVSKAKMILLKPFTDDLTSLSWSNYWKYEMKPNYYSALLTIVLMGYTTLISTTFELLNCVELPDKSASVIFKAGSNTCFQAWQIPIFFLVYCLVLPFPYYVFKFRKILRSYLPRGFEYFFDLETVSIHVSDPREGHRNIIILKLLAILEGGYQDYCLYYETIFMARRLLIQTVFIVFNEPVYSSLFVAILCLGAVLVNFNIRPFGKKSWQMLEDVNLTILTILSILNAQAGARASSGIAYSIRSITDVGTVSITVILILVPIGIGFGIIFKQMVLFMHQISKWVQGKVFEKFNDYNEYEYSHTHDIHGFQNTLRDPLISGGDDADLSLGLDTMSGTNSSYTIN